MRKDDAYNTNWLEVKRLYQEQFNDQSAGQGRKQGETANDYFHRVAKVGGPKVRSPLQTPT